MQYILIALELNIFQKKFMGMEDEKLFKEKEISIEILKILSLSENI